MSDIRLYDIDIEESLLSSIIFDPENAYDLVSKLSSEDFFVPVNSKIFKTIKSLISEEKPIDEVFIAQKLASTESDIQNILLEICSRMAITHYVAYIEKMKDYTKKRKLSTLAFEIKSSLEKDDDTQAIMNHTMDSMDGISNVSTSTSGNRTVTQILDEIYTDMEAARSGEKKPFCETGYMNFDRAIGGFVLNGLSIVAGRPSMGKSSFISGAIVDRIEKGDSAVLYSMEVVDKSALTRLLSFRSQEPLSSIRMGAVSNYNSFTEATKFFSENESQLSIVDRSGMTRQELEMDILKRIREDDKLELIIVDHLLQVAIDQKGHGPTELGHITKMLKRIAQNYRKTIVLLSQLNRGVESRENKRPMMADLQGSGSIEQDADLIIFLYRKEYYLEKEWDQDEKGPYQKKDIEDAEAIVGKNRDGPTGSVELSFRAVTASFLNKEVESIVIEYVDDNIDMNGAYEGSIKGLDDTITKDGGDTLVTMPLI